MKTICVLLVLLFTVGVCFAGELEDKLKAQQAVGEKIVSEFNNAQDRLNLINEKIALLKLLEKLQGDYASLLDEIAKTEAAIDEAAVGE